MNALVIFALTVFCCVTCCYATCRLGVYDQHVSRREHEKIVNIHNQLRLRIAHGNVPGQPRGINLRRMHYSGTLARKAQEVANTCNFEHVKITGTRWSWVGQNLYISFSTGFGRGAHWNAAIQSWFDEYKQYRFGSGFSHATGHYTQLVWAKTTHVGCGYTYFPTGEYWKYKKLYVCNYGPGGNIQGQNPYKTGSKGCSNLC